jgi:heme oxygenase
MNHTLATRLRLGTKKAHTIAENVGFVQCFLKGVVEKQSYRKLVANFYFIYCALEEAIENHHAHPAVSKINFPQLHRKQALEQDLLFYYGEHWQEQIQPSPVAVVYVKRIQQLSESKPEQLIAHAYTRYLGDLSGGQIFKGIAQRAMNLSDGKGTAFYEFAEIPNTKAFKASYRQVLNELPLSIEDCEQIVEEANYAFGLVTQLYQELEGNLIKAIGLMLYNSLAHRFSSPKFAVN